MIRYCLKLNSSGLRWKSKCQSCHHLQTLGPAYALWPWITMWYVSIGQTGWDSWSQKNEDTETPNPALWMEKMGMSLVQCDILVTLLILFMNLPVESHHVNQSPAAWLSHNIDASIYPMSVMYTFSFRFLREAPFFASSPIFDIQLLLPLCSHGGGWITCFPMGTSAWVWARRSSCGSSRKVECKMSKICRQQELCCHLARTRPVSSPSLWRLYGRLSLPSF